MKRRLFHKGLSLFLSFLLLFICCVPAYAEPGDIFSDGSSDDVMTQTDDPVCTIMFDVGDDGVIDGDTFCMVDIDDLICFPDVVLSEAGRSDIRFVGWQPVNGSVEQPESADAWPDSALTTVIYARDTRECTLSGLGAETVGATYWFTAVYEPVYHVHFQAGEHVATWSGTKDEYVPCSGKDVAGWVSPDGEFIGHSFDNETVVGWVDGSPTWPSGTTVSDILNAYPEHFVRNEITFYELYEAVDEYDTQISETSVILHLNAGEHARFWVRGQGWTQSVDWTGDSSEAIPLPEIHYDSFWDMAADGDGNFYTRWMLNVNDHEPVDIALPETLTIDALRDAGYIDGSPAEITLTLHPGPAVKYLFFAYVDTPGCRPGDDEYDNTPVDIVGAMPGETIHVQCCIIGNSGTVDIAQAVIPYNGYIFDDYHSGHYSYSDCFETVTTDTYANVQYRPDYQGDCVNIMRADFQIGLEPTVVSTFDLKVKNKPDNDYYYYYDSPTLIIREPVVFVDGEQVFVDTGDENHYYFYPEYNDEYYTGICKIAITDFVRVKVYQNNCLFDGEDGPFRYQEYKGVTNSIDPFKYAYDIRYSNPTTGCFDMTPVENIVEENAVTGKRNAITFTIPAENVTNGLTVDAGATSIRGSMAWKAYAPGITFAEYSNNEKLNDAAVAYGGLATPDVQYDGQSMRRKVGQTDFVFGNLYTYTNSELNDIRWHWTYYNDLPELSIPLQPAGFEPDFYGETEPDINQDGRIDSYDAAVIMNAFRGADTLVRSASNRDPVTLESYFRCDVNHDDKIDALDFADWTFEYGDSSDALEFVVTKENRDKLGYSLNNEEVSGQLYIPKTFRDENGVKHTVTGIGDDAFADCTGLTGTIRLPSTVELIGDRAFYNCTGLTGGIVIPEKVTEIGEFAFQNCSGLKGGISLTSNVRVIEQNAFAGCSELQGTVRIPDGMIRISEGAFSGCTSLDKIEIPGRPDIADTAFENVPYIHSHSVSAGFPYGARNENDVFYSYNGNDTHTKTCGYGEVLAENESCSYSDGSTVCTFCKNETITYTDFTLTEDNRDRIGYSTYAYEATGKLDIPSLFQDTDGTYYRVVSIGDDAFYYCNGLTGDVVIPNSVVSIGSDAFRNCTGLDGQIMFGGDLRLQDDTSESSLLEIGSDAFSGCNKLIGGLIIPNTVTSIEGYAFDDCSALEGQLSLSENLTAIGAYAFNNCSKLTLAGDLVIPDGTISISNGVFSRCRGLNGRLVLPDTLEKIGSSAFWGCEGLKGDLVIPDSVVEIGNLAFVNCEGFETLTLPNNLTKIGSQVFLSCGGFTGDLVLPESVTEIVSNAFWGCENFDSITIPDTVTKIGNSAFSYVKHIYYSGSATGSPWGAYAIN